METRMNNEDMQNEKENTPVKSGRLRLGRIQLLGLVVVVALIVIGLISRSNSQSDESVATVQKSLLETAEDALALNPQDSEAWYTKGVYLQTEVGDNQAAVESYSRAIEINAEYLAALFNRGLAYKSLGRLDKAIADFESVVELKNGEAPRALYNLGLIANDEGDTELGDEYLQKAYELDPSLKP
jgi:tetratricopeptide (TPR) repeat protein